MPSPHPTPGPPHAPHLQAVTLAEEGRIQLYVADTPVRVVLGELEQAAAGAVQDAQQLRVTQAQALQGVPHGLHHLHEARVVGGEGGGGAA